jgi:uncharacterized DUF497 family protein
VPFRWDSAKARANVEKHGGDVAEATGVFGRTSQEDGIRVISARKATPRERRNYARQE